MRYSYPLPLYTVSIIAHFNFFKSSMILFWVAIRSSSKESILPIFFCSCKQGLWLGNNSKADFEIMGTAWTAMEDK